MAQDNGYHDIIAESFSLDANDRSGHHGDVHIRSLPGQKFGTHLFVECSKSLMDPAQHPVVTKFKIRAKLTDREGCTEFLYSHYKGKVEVFSNKDAAAFIKRSSKR